MASTCDERKQELQTKLLIPDHCPSTWNWQEFCMLGKAISFSRENRGSQNASIQFGWDRWARGLTANPGCTGLEFIQHEKLMSHECECNHFARITKLDTTGRQQFRGYFDPNRRRAIFFLGESFESDKKPEPPGLLLFFIWHSRFEQQISRLPEFLRLFLFSPKDLTFGQLDFANFLEICDAVGENKNESLQGAKKIAADLVGKFKKDGQHNIDLYCSCHSSHEDEAKAMQEIFDAVDTNRFLLAINDASTLSESIRAVMNYILETRKAIRKDGSVH